ncbi:MAG: AraC family ligand binding domain-containing protein, partial [Lachnospiraceae bacterium]|nr:AraC family ligand binding domain-containing protein [Lachnospiraceae bacterium]
MPEQKRGYLTSDFKVFHLRTEEKKDFDFHYHDFDKIIIFLQGNVTYSVEGKNYKLKPYDIVL